MFSIDDGLLKEKEKSKSRAKGFVESRFFNAARNLYKQVLELDEGWIFHTGGAI